MKKILVLLLVIMYHNIMAQNKIDRLLATGHYQEVIPLLQQDTTAVNKRKLSTLYQKIGKIEAAYNCLNNIPSKTVTDSVHLAQLNYKMGNQLEALISYELLYNAHPDNLLLGIEIAAIYYKNEEFNKAVEHYKKLIVKDSTNSYLHYKLARSYSKENEHKKASIHYKKTLKLSPKQHKSMFYLAEHYNDYKKYDKAIYYIEKALQIAPRNLNYLKLNTHIYYNSASFDKSISVAKKIIALDPKNTFAYNSIGLSFYNQNQLDSAMTYQMKAVLFDFQNAEYAKNAGLIAEKKQDYKSAKRLYLISLQNLEEEKYSQLYHLGLIALAEKNKATAINYFKQAFKNNSNFYGALYMQAVTSDGYYKDKQIALKLYKKYLAKFKTSNPEKTTFVKQRITSIKEKLFFENTK